MMMQTTGIATASRMLAVFTCTTQDVIMYVNGTISDILKVFSDCYL